MLEIHKRTIAEFAAILEGATIARLNFEGVACQANIDNARTRIVEGKKYHKVDVGTSGKYMIEVSTGIIFGVKGYGKIHRGHVYGNLSTVHLFNWGGYTAVPISDVARKFVREEVRS